MPMFWENTIPLGSMVCRPISQQYVIDDGNAPAAGVYSIVFMIAVIEIIIY